MQVINYSHSHVARGVLSALSPATLPSWKAERAEYWRIKSEQVRNRQTDTKATSPVPAIQVAKVVQGYGDERSPLTRSRPVQDSAEINPLLQDAERRRSGGKYQMPLSAADSANPLLRDAEQRRVKALGSESSQDMKHENPLIVDAERRLQAAKQKGNYAETSHRD